MTGHAFILNQNRFLDVQIQMQIIMMKLQMKMMEHANILKQFLAMAWSFCVTEAMIK